MQAREISVKWLHAAGNIMLSFDILANRNF